MHDIHIHTSHSACARPDSSLAEYLPVLPERGLSIAGFSNHLWDSAIPGPNEFYQPQDIEHLLPLKKDLADACVPGVKLLFGCELEYCGKGRISLHPDHAELFVYILVAPDHFHMKDLVRPASLGVGEELAELFYSRFMEVCEIDFVDGIAHPFFPIGFDGRDRDVFDLLSDRRLEVCFRHARACGKTVELNLSCLNKLRKKDLLPEYRRVMTIAAECGSRFHLGSDAHGVHMLGAELFELGRTFAAECGIVFPDDPFAGKR